MPVPEIIKELVGKFDGNRDLYCGPGYNETRLRREFLDPFFEALGWDVDNTGGVSPVYQEVVHEYGTDVEGSQKTADYAFRIGERVKFFVEAKKPGVRLKEDAGPAYQLRKYAYSKQLPLSILTDFEEFAVYDGRVKPAEKDTAAKARVVYLTYQDYVERWDDIETVFGREAIWKGAFDKFADENKGGKHEPLDKTFLAMLERWRDLLARNVANRNRDLDLDRYALTWAVQAILDRIIFLQVAEARGIEPDRRLLDAAEGPGVYEKLVAIFREADDRYNSGLFHFRKEKDRPGRRDELTPGLSLDDAVLRKIINELYDSPYEFGVVPVEILGHAYEQFLGKTIYVDGRGVHIDDKPEVRKAGGVYYTPEYIVEYIVENTVGKLLEKRKAPKDVVNLKILDPACGSGSFLLGAYQRLLDWHLEWYFKDGPEKHTDKLIPIGGGMPLVGGGEERRSWRLSIAEKKRILLNNIYGVDIDASAVEVTKLSLLLKALEGESAESVGAQEKLYKDRALPDLANNVKCGNSLIGWDYFDGQLSPDPDEVRRVNPFDWDKEFTDIMSVGGFDAVIGNPPYVNAINLVELFGNQREYLTQSAVYKTLYQKWDLYVAFIERGLGLLRENGYLSMIIPYPFINQLYARLSREEIINNKRLIAFVDLSKVKVFKTVVVKNCILIVKNEKPKGETRIVELVSEGAFVKRGKKDQRMIMAKEGIWVVDTNERAVILEEGYVKLGDLCFISIGMVLNADEFKAKGKFKKEELISETRTRVHKKPYIEAKDIDRYEVNRIRWLEWGSERVPALIRRPTFPELYEVDKILVNKIGEVKATLDNESLTCDQTIRVLVLWKDLNGIENKSINNSVRRYCSSPRHVLEKNSEGYDLRFILGILNSRFGIPLLNTIRGVGNIDINPEYLKSIPIPVIEINNPADAAKHKAMVAMVDRMLDLHKRLAAAKAPNEREALQREIDATDARIDALVYELYDLTDEEIKIVEGSD